VPIVACSRRCPAGRNTSGIAGRTLGGPSGSTGNVRSAVEHELRGAGARLGVLDVEVVGAIERRGAAAKECLVSAQ
jgi:hypothetical protein